MRVLALDRRVLDAVKRGDAEGVRRELRADPGQALARDAGGETALHWGAFCGHAAVCEVLLRADPPADANARDAGGRTPLHEGASRGRAEACAVLLRHGAEVAARTLPPDGWTPLHAAAVAGSTPGVAFLLQAGARPDARDARGRTPLHTAAEAGRSWACALLLRAGADAGARDASGRTPADAAAASCEVTRDMLSSWAGGMHPAQAERQAVLGALRSRMPAAVAEFCADFSHVARRDGKG